ncbi:uncharacterized protein TrAFT101_003086 [Trichoderma asperellum]|uniref:uncharacterized protein n=1 Tax=Trichoderma asperellum TaxID=101201 RepID=UPI003331E30E|nr:hypothetical protein TrAFT101_003086 [Trichoderma asperellum]
MRQNDGHSTGKRRSQHLMEAKASKKRLLCSDILVLPTEILLLIIDNLPLPWRFSLALTCKYFTELTHRSALPRLEGEELTEFLFTLQKDIPNTFFCYCCHKLRLLDPNLKWESQAHAWTLRDFRNSYWLPDSCNAQHVSLPEKFRHSLFSTQISFMEANLVMSRHFYGFSHGIPLQSLERYKSFEHILEFGKCVRSHKPGCKYQRCTCFYKPWRRSGKKDVIRNGIVDPKTQLPGESLEALSRMKNTWKFSLRYTPKIIDDKLFIARFYTIVGPTVSEEHIKRLIRIPYPQDDGKAIEFDPEQDSCLLCSTDYNITLNQGPSNNETHLNISIYHCLGPCRSPSDKLWDYSAGPLTPFSQIVFKQDSTLENHSQFSGGATDFFGSDVFEDHFRSWERYQLQQQLWFQELKSRVPELDRGSIRRKWHEAA